MLSDQQWPRATSRAATRLHPPGNVQRERVGEISDDEPVARTKTSSCWTERHGGAGEAHVEMQRFRKLRSLPVLRQLGRNVG